jgi:uncharacterized protein (TIGR03382 family)
MGILSRDVPRALRPAMGATAAAAAALVFLAGAPCRADLTNYSSRAEFDAAVGKHEVVTFTDLTAGTVLTTQLSSRGLTFADGTDVVFDSTAFVDRLGVAGGPNDAPPSNIDIRFAVPQSAVGADFPGSVTFDLYRSGALVGTSSQFGSAGSGFFGGVVSSLPFDQAVIRDTVDGRPYVDNLHYVRVPEPATCAGALAALALAAVGRRRRGPAART